MGTEINEIMKKKPKDTKNWFVEKIIITNKVFRCHGG